MCKPSTILSSKVAHFDVRSFWRALARQNKKVLTEKCIIDSISSSNASYQVLVVHTANDIKGWKPNLDWLRHTLRQRADAHGGKLVAIVLDQHGHLVKQNDMSNDDSGEQISEIIALLGGGAHGIDHNSKAAIVNVIRNYADHILQLALPGETMHSYNALSNVFILYNVKVLYGLIATISVPPAGSSSPSSHSESLPSTPPHKDTHIFHVADALPCRLLYV